ncbi:MAG: hypothetical protein NZ602_02755 [Thermoguttaceae bacterium]|nr:hypothetical protein [Thermoguttaceae bacterium]MDW8036773.1 hypothetical protein [Thermoguttaceae bacterium]
MGKQFCGVRQSPVSHAWGQGNRTERLGLRRLNPGAACFFSLIGVGRGPRQPTYPDCRRTLQRLGNPQDACIAA